MKPANPDAIGRLLAAPEIGRLLDSLTQARAVSANGLWGSSVAAVVAAIQAKLHRPVVLVCGHLDEADDLADDVELFAGHRPEVLPALELGGGLGRVSEEQASARLRLISRYAAGGKTAPAMLVAPVQALMQSAPAKSELQHLMRTVKAGQSLEPEKLIVWLSDHGYNRLEQVEVPGDFAVRGGIIDIYLPGEFDADSEQVGQTVRIDFFGDQVESIKRFDLDTLGSSDKLESVSLTDLKGQLPDTGSSTHLFSYVDPETVVVLRAPLEIAEQAKSYLDRLPEQKGIYPLAAVLKNIGGLARVELSQFDQGTSAMPSLIAGGEVPNVRLPIASLQRFETEAKKAIAELAELATTHDVNVFCENEGEQKRFCELVEGDVPGLCAKIVIALGYLHRGFVYDGAGEKPLALFGHHELFHRYEQRRRVKKVIASRPVDSFLDLKVGDYVVHVAHGIAKFTGMHQIAKDGKQEEYLTLRFAEDAVLHVPAARINLIQKYVGNFSGHPQLSRLGSGAWEKQKAKVSEAVMDMAAELIDVQAARNAELGLAYPPDT
ncbi:MAG: hypothetical protein JO353_10635, partial [Phycisphaerae bacterium]|nr:hypothetical protein [Phycisphaerae bacterium]